jgi:hypothetical protein
MERQMDRWMEGQMDRQRELCGGKGRWKERQMDSWMVRQTDGKNRRTDGWKDKQMDRYIFGWKYLRIERQIYNGWLDR